MRLNYIINFSLFTSVAVGTQFDQQSFEREAAKFLNQLNETFEPSDITPFLDEFIKNEFSNSIPLDDMPLIKPNIQDIIDLLPLAKPLLAPYMGEKTSSQLVNYGQMSLELTHQLSQVPEFQKLDLNREDNEEVPMKMPVKYALAETLTSRKTKVFIQQMMKKAFVL
ncbi:hypothetical protein CONCODRAFT_9733 [Conidiobolus coronatus NRRL 28638]|uniref:Uncharacterized protein n=1 Tax=Conidiobolus coronatus (strain ATCC 28846 / CBS 209.66 / NRRL 28638) TaxID=796925 RepID=A0A137NZ39_CONC2|nr:hypothetical protein CONCODRAFT_9733 [Conidiobolus coronatus NRRL 28638]|eukprot:KXN68093.1 hypothetical protein CONCODRAFT_9733 [Conidiobolus coronatus NRRL 28638]